jgi:hypothetical protein
LGLYNFIPIAADQTVSVMALPDSFSTMRSVMTHDIQSSKEPDESTAIALTKGRKWHEMF